METAIERGRLSWVPPLTLGASGMALLAAYSALCVGMPAFDWNSARVAPAVAWARGLPLYAGADHGSLQTTLYGPVKEILISVAALGSTPSEAIWIAGGVNTLCLVMPILCLPFLLAPSRPRSQRVAAALFGAASLLLAKSTRYMAEFVHVDAPAVGLGLASCLLLLSSPRPGSTRLTCAASLSVLAAWTKQVDVPVVLAQLVYLGIRQDLGTTLRYAVRLAVAALCFGTVFLLSFGADELWFNLWVLPRDHPKYLTPPTLAWASLEMVVAASFGALFALLAVRADPESGLRQRSWFLLILAAAALAPTSMIGRLIAGGGPNSYHFVYFLLAAAVAILARGELTPRSPVAGRRLAFILAVGAVVIVLPSVPWRALKAPYANPQESAYRFARSHPGEVYVPWSPLVTLYSDGDLYHFDFSVHDRLVAGHAPSLDHFDRHIPQRLRFVVYRPKPFSTTARRYLRQMDRQTSSTELPGWQIWTHEGRDSEGSRPPSPD